MIAINLLYYTATPSVIAVKVVFRFRCNFFIHWKCDFHTFYGEFLKPKWVGRKGKKSSKCQAITRLSSANSGWMAKVWKVETIQNTTTGLRPLSSNCANMEYVHTLLNRSRDVCRSPVYNSSRQANKYLRAMCSETPFVGVYAARCQTLSYKDEFLVYVLKFHQY